MSFAVVLLIISLVAIIYLISKSFQEKTEADADEGAARESRVQAAVRCLENLIHRGVFIRFNTDVSPGFELRPGEELIFVLSNISVVEPRAVRTSRGTYGGTSVRVVKGLYLHLGQSRGVSESHDELRTVDCGTLCLTGQRLIFTGPKKTLSFNLAKIIQLRSFTDGIRFNFEGKEKPELFIFDAWAAITINFDGNVLSAPLDGRIIELVIRQVSPGSAPTADRLVKIPTH